MKLLTFQAKRFAWRSFSKTLPDAADNAAADALEECIVVFAHAEAEDFEADERASVLRQVLKHVKWLANKRGMRNVVLHSFTHLGAASAEPHLARDFLAELALRLSTGGFCVKTTPFGWMCEWDLGVHGDSLAKVWKEI